MSCDYAVIGAGVSGMAAALILARQGYSVTLVERAPKAAPLLRGFTRQGLRFDSGFHYAGGLGEGQILSSYLQHLGVAQHLKLEPEPAQDTLRFLHTNEDVALPYGYEPLAESLCRRFPQESEGIRHYLAAVRGIFEATPFLHLEAEDEPGYTPLHGTSLAAALEGWIRDPLLRHILGLHHFFYGVTPECISFLDHARFVGSYYASTRFICGGGHALARGFETALQEAGVELQCGRSVQRILCSSSGELQGLAFSDGETLSCRGAIASVHPKILVSIAPEGAFRPAYAAMLQNLEETPSAYMLFGSSDKPLLHLDAGAMHIISRPGVSLAGLETQPLDSRQLFLAKAGQGNGAGGQTLGLICPAPCSEMDDYGDAKRRLPGYAQRKEAVAQELEARLLAACPELQGSWRRLDAATPLTFRRYAGTPTGSLYGVQHALDARCPLPQTRLPGLYVAGQAVAGPGVLGATVSAYVACSRIVGLKQLLSEVRQCI